MSGERKGVVCSRCGGTGRVPVPAARTAGGYIPAILPCLSTSEWPRLLPPLTEASINILALDLGTRCGWALRENGRIESGVQTFDVKRGESPGMRYLRFRRWLRDIVSTQRGILTVSRVELITYEQTHNRGGAATEVAAGFATRVQEFCAEYGLEHAAIHSATLKKFVTGSGRGDKSGMYAAACKRGWLEHGITTDDNLVDDNEVDAICLLHYALAEIAVPAQRGAP